MYLEDVIVASIAVPEFSGALVAEAELELGAHLQLLTGELELEAELVGAALAAARHVLRVRLPHAAPPVRGPPHRHRLVEGDVEDAHDAEHGAGALHEGVLEADLLGEDRVEEGGVAAGLGEHGDQGGGGEAGRGHGDCGRQREPGGRHHGRPNLDI